MKKKGIIFTVILAMLYIALSSDIDGAAHHGHGNVTGSPSGSAGHCQTSSCHGGNSSLNVVQLQVTDTATTLPITTYNALQTYLVTLTGDATAVTTALPGFGFQASAVLGNHTQAGTFVIPSTLTGSIHTYPCGATTVVEHSLVLSPTATGSNKYSISFYWTAPPPASDSVTFFAMLNAVNRDGGSSGDHPNAAPHVTIYENPATTTCGTPTGLTDSAVTPTSVRLSWNAVVGAVGYKVQYRLVATSSWTSATATANSTTISGLSAASEYEFGVQTICSGSPSLFAATNDTVTTAAVNGVQIVTGSATGLSVYPNPALNNPTISYNLPSAETVSIAVFDATGRKVEQFANNEFQASGAHQYQSGITAPGLYIVQLISGSTYSLHRFVKL